MRLDLFLVARGDYETRSRAAHAIERGCVLVNGKPRKASFDVKEGDEVSVGEDLRLASLGGYKLMAACDAFHFPIEGKVFADVGASNGGFTHVLLMNGAKRVYAVDVGEDQLEDFLKEEARVVVMDRMNARELEKESFPEMIESAVADLSFISLTTVFPAFSRFVQDEVITLVKPQFECGRKALGKSGIVTDLKARISAVKAVWDAAKKEGFYLSGLCPAPIREGKNVEFLAYFQRETKRELSEEEMERIVKAAR